MTTLIATILAGLVLGLLALANFVQSLLKAWTDGTQKALDDIKFNQRYPNPPIEYQLLRAQTIDELDDANRKATTILSDKEST